MRKIFDQGAILVLVEHLTEKKMLPGKGYVKEKAEAWSRNVAAQLLMS